MSDNGKKYQLESGSAAHYQGDERITPGQPFTPTEHERELLGDVLVPVHSESEDSPDGTADEQGADEFVDHNADDVAASIESGDADGHLAEVREAEAAGRDRVTVHDTLDERAEETGEDAGESGE